jgi:hypothetical protein
MRDPESIKRDDEVKSAAGYKTVGQLAREGTHMFYRIITIIMKRRRIKHLTSVSSIYMGPPASHPNPSLTQPRT